MSEKRTEMNRKASWYRWCFAAATIAWAVVLRDIALGTMHPSVWGDRIADTVPYLLTLTFATCIVVADYMQFVRCKKRIAAREQELRNSGEPVVAKVVSTKYVDTPDGICTIFVLTGTNDKIYISDRFVGKLEANPDEQYYVYCNPSAPDSYFVDTSVLVKTLPGDKRP